MDIGININKEQYKTKQDRMELLKSSVSVEGVETALRVYATPFRRVSRWPKAVARERGRNLRRRVEVSKGISWIYFHGRGRGEKWRERGSQRSGGGKTRCGLGGESVFVGIRRFGGGCGGLVGVER